MNESIYHRSTPIGIHRLKKEPFDDREIFTDISNMLYYCKHGARYDGQKISCILGENNTKYIQDFIIINDYPILQFKNIEHTVIKDNDKYYILIYHYNPIGYSYPDNIMIRYSHNISIKNPDKFSIIGLMDVFRSDLAEIYNTTGDINYTTLITPSANIETQFEFKISLKDVTNESNQINIDITQNDHPMFPRASNYNASVSQLFFVPNLNCFKLAILNAPGSPTTNYQIYPTNPDINSDNYIIDIYIEATEYIRAFGGDLNGL